MAFFSLFAKFLPTIAPAAYLVYVVTSGQTALILPAATAAFSAFGINLHLVTAAQTASETSALNSLSLGNLHDKVNSLMGARSVARPTVDRRPESRESIHTVDRPESRESIHSVDSND